MREDQVKTFIEANLSKIVLGCAGSVYPDALKSEAMACKEYILELPVVGHQMVCTEGSQILSFLAMDLSSYNVRISGLYACNSNNIVQYVHYHHLSFFV